MSTALNGLHTYVPDVDRHSPYRQVFADAAARTSDAGPYLDPLDLYKTAYQVDTGETYVLTATSPVTWTPLFAAGVTPGAVDHGTTTGLGDDDHPQYLNETRHDALPADNPHNVTAAQAGADPAGSATAAGAAAVAASAAALAAHESAADPHPGYQLESLLSAAIAEYNDRSHFLFPTTIVGDAGNGGDAANFFLDHFSQVVTFAHNALYNIRVPFFWSNNSISTDILVELRVDGVLVASDAIRAEPPDVAGADPQGSTSGTDQKYSDSLEGAFTPPVAGGTHTVSLAFAASTANDFPTIYSSSLWAQRWTL